MPYWSENLTSNTKIMSRIDKIIKIIHQRRPFAETIATVEKNLNTLAVAMRQLESQRTLLLSRGDESSLALLPEIDLNSPTLKLTRELEALAKLRIRFSRDTLNLGVVGRARQGKSRLLQSLTGLTAAEIPDGDRQHCTGVRSTIHHNPSLDTYGEVWFHSEQTFLAEVIHPYYEQLELGIAPFSLEEFASKALPDKNVQGAEAGAKYEHLRRYHTHLEKYRHLLRESSPRRIARDEIREYVAQDNAKGDRIYFNYLAVREVKIVCTFPNTEVGQIALVDMPGLGDTGIGDEERLIQTLGQDIDAVLFVRMPKSLGDYWADVDVRLYDTARNALTELPLERWSFMVLNRTPAGSSNGDNGKNCQDLAETLTEKHLSVVDCLITNCADATEANQALDHILDYLADQITTLDQAYAATCQKRVLQLQQEVSAELEKARIAFGDATPRENWFPLFETLFAQLWNEITRGLEKLLRELKEQRNSEDIDFKQQVEQALERCRQDTGLPTLEAIETRRDAAGGYPNAYYQYLNEVRAYLSQHFLSLDEGLKRSLLRVKSQVAQVLVEQGHLGELSPARDYLFLSDLAQFIPSHLGKLKLGFLILAEFEISYRGLIQHRIRKHLDGLTPDATPLQLSKSPSAKELLANLTTLHAEAVYGCETALEDLLCEPSQAAFAIVEEFVDRILRAEGAKTEWRIFLEEVRDSVWKDEFVQLGDRTRIRREWLDSVERVTLANQPHFLQFLN